MSKKNAAAVKVPAGLVQPDDYDTMPEGAVPVAGELVIDFVPRSGEERVREGAPMPDADGIDLPCFEIWPANKNSKAEPEHGPFLGKCPKTHRRFFYFTHVVKDPKTGEFLPKNYGNVWPDDLRVIVDAKQERRAKLDAWRKLSGLNRGR